MCPRRTEGGTACEDRPSGHRCCKTTTTQPFTVAPTWTFGHDARVLVWRVPGATFSERRSRRIEAGPRSWGIVPTAAPLPPSSTRRPSQGGVLSLSPVAVSNNATVLGCLPCAHAGRLLMHWPACTLPSCSRAIATGNYVPTTHFLPLALLGMDGRGVVVHGCVFRHHAPLTLKLKRRGLTRLLMSASVLKRGKRVVAATRPSRAAVEPMSRSA